MVVLESFLPFNLISISKSSKLGLILDFVNWIIFFMLVLLVVKNCLFIVKVPLVAFSCSTLRPSSK